MKMYIPSKSIFDPDDRGYFGNFGGRFVPETLIPTVLTLEKEYKKIRFDSDFWQNVNYYLKDYVGRPSPLYFAKNISKELNAKIYLKREDLNHTGSHKINNTIAQGLLAKKIGKRKIIAETGAGQHGVAVATIATLLSLDCEIFMGAKDVARQELNVFKMKLLGAKVTCVDSGSQTLKDAMNEAIRDWVKNVENTFYLIGSVDGPHPYPMMVRDMQAIIGFEAKNQILKAEGRLPDILIACVGGGSNAVGLFSPFLNDKNSNRCRFIGIEAGGKGVSTNKHAATLTKGSKGILHGQLTYVLQDKNGQIMPTYSISAGLDYPGVGPEHSFLNETKKVEYDSIEDKEAIDAFLWLSKSEGIMPALESSHAIAYLRKMPKSDIKNSIAIVNLSGRGDKDIKEVRKVCLKR